MSLDRPPTAPVGGPRSGSALIVVTVMAVTVALAIAKPWAGAPPDRTAAEANAGPSPAASSGGSSVAEATGPTAGPSAEPIACLSEAGWRLSTVERSDRRVIKTWYSITPVAATGPSDAAIPTTRVFAQSLERLGYCAGLQADLPGSTATSGWLALPSRAPVPISLATTVDPGLGEADRDVLFVPPSEAPGATPPDWLPGRYVFAIRTGPAPGDRLWFAAEVIECAQCTT